MTRATSHGFLTRWKRTSAYARLKPQRSRSSVGGVGRVVRYTRPRSCLARPGLCGTAHGLRAAILMEPKVPGRGRPAVRRPAVAHAGNECSENERWVDAARVADYLSVKPSWVYANAEFLGARRLGTGPKPSLRFKLAEVDRRLAACSPGRQSPEPETPMAKPVRHRRRPARLGTGVELLPVRGSA